MNFVSTAGRIMLVLILATGCGEEQAPVPRPPATGPVPYVTFDIDSLVQARASRGGQWMEFVTRGGLRAGLYHLDSGAVDGQTPHGEDEVYYIVRGSGLLTADTTTRPAAAGEIHYVRANVPHHFHDITEPMDVIVIFSTTTPTGSGSDFESFTPTDMAQSRQAGQNVWNPFLQRSTMVAGLYMLPQAVGGDAGLTHTTDEINIIASGEGELVVGEDRIPFAPGSIVFVDRGAAHRFETLTADTDVIIIWNQ